MVKGSDFIQSSSFTFRLLNDVFVDDDFRFLKATPATCRHYKTT